MRGLTRGEESDATNQVLQLFTRSGELLVDPISGSFVIEDVRDPDVAPIVRVASTALVLTDVGVGGHKLGLGRFLIPTGPTTTWAFGTHRVTYDYVMVASGRTYKQVVEFEVLNPTQFATGQGYIGYAATRDLYESEVFDLTTLPPDKLHKHINLVSKQIEAWTGRFFEPRFLQILMDGSERPVQFVEHAIVAMEKLESVARSPNSSNTSVQEFDSAGYRVFNRHLDGLVNPDDRDNPKITLVSDLQVAGITPIDQTFHWPFGRQNIRLTGVFGFTDPDPQSDRVLIGNTPADFVLIITALVTRRLEDPTLSNLATWKPGLVRTYKTRDQMISFYGASGNVNYTGGFTGDAIIDQMLMRFVKPARLSYPDRVGC